MDYSTLESEFLAPLVSGWLANIELATEGRREWEEIANECMMFYSRSAAAMWDPRYTKKFWKGVKAPKFQVTINKAFELVAIYGPNLFWEVPNRTVEPKRRDIPPDVLQGYAQMQVEEKLALYQGLVDPQQLEQIKVQLMNQAMVQANESMGRKAVQDKALTYLLSQWLNYTPREQPGGGLACHGFRATVDALIMGRGVLATRPYRMPGSDKTLTGAFRVRPTDVYLDPDFDSVDEIRWMAIKHVDVYTDVEKRFGLKRGSLKGKTTLESMWQSSRVAIDDEGTSRRASGQTNDTIVWYEVFSTAGVGCLGTPMDEKIKNHLNRVVGDNAYIAVSPNVPYPLNMPSEKIRRGASDDEVRQAFSWPIPFWKDKRWPVEFLDYYDDPESAWPVAPLAPALGELKLLNFLFSWFANRTWSSSRDFWAVASPHIEHYRDYILNGEDQTIIPSPPGVKSVSDGVEILTQPEGRQDMTQLISFVSEMFNQRTGLTAALYGQNEGGTQNRTAEETIAKQAAVMTRPEFMAKRVVDWQSRVAAAEAHLSQMVVRGRDVEGLLGEIGAAMWERFVSSQDAEKVMRQYQFTIAAASIRRPNRDRDIANFQQVMGLFAPSLDAYAQRTGNYQPYNAMMAEWGRLHDANLDGLQIPMPTPEEQQKSQAVAERQQNAQVAEMEAKAAKTAAEAAKARVEAELAPAEVEAELAQTTSQLQLEGIRQETEQIRQQGELGRLTLEQQIRERQSDVELLQDAERHDQNLRQDQQSHEQEMRQKTEMAKVMIATKRAQAQAAKDAREKPDGQASKRGTGAASN